MNNLFNITEKHAIYLQFQLGKKFTFYFLPIISFFGLIGNTLSFIVYGNMKHRKKSSSIYLRVLSLVDIAILIPIVFHYWLISNFFPNVFTDKYCYGLSYSVHVVGCCSHWLIVIITIDRFIGISYPLKRTSVCTPKRRKAALICITVASVLKNLHYLWTTDFSHGHLNTTPMCSLGIVRKTPIIVAVKWFESLVNSMLPFIIIFTLNLFIIWKLKERYTTFHIKPENNIKEEHKSRKNKQNYGTTIILLMVSISFLGLKYPIVIHHLYFSKKDVKHDVKLSAVQYLSLSICYCLWTANHSIHIFIYSIFGKQFRSDLCRLITKCWDFKCFSNTYDTPVLEV